MTFLNSLLESSTEWEALSEYSVGFGTVASPILVSQTAPINPSPSDIATLATNVASSWGVLSGREIFVIYFPASSGLSGSYYHSAVTIGSAQAPVQFAVISGYTDVPTDGYVQFHEISEAATDPITTEGGYNLPSHDYLSWSLLGSGTELSDMCVQSDFGSSVDLGIGMKPDWLNSRLAAGEDPCPPAGVDALPSFGGYPILKDTYASTIPVSNPSFSQANAAVKIAPGDTAIVQIQMFSYGQLPAEMTLSITQPSPVLIVSLGTAQGKNGDIVSLSITAPSEAFPASNRYATFAVIATVTGSDGKVHRRAFPGLGKV